MINRVVLVGRLTKDPELKYTPAGVANARFTLAVNRSFASQNGEREADFIQCTVWRKQAENTANYLKKGSLAGIEGRIQTGSYEGQDGKRVYTTEVVADSVQFLEPRGQNGAAEGGRASGQPNTPGTQYNGANGQSGSNSNTQNYNSGPVEVSDDDLPF